MNRMRKSNKQNAIRQASSRMEDRIKAVVAREKAVEAALAEYLLHADKASRLESDAAARAEAIMAEGRAQAASANASASGALARLEELGESRTGIAELTGLTSADVRVKITEAKATATASLDGDAADEPPMTSEKPGLIAAE